MHFDGSLTKETADGGLIFMLPIGEQLQYAVRLRFQASNNVAKYEALVNDLCIAIELGVRHLDVRGDSKLVVGQVMNKSKCHDPKMATYCWEVRRLED